MRCNGCSGADMGQERGSSAIPAKPRPSAIADSQKAWDRRCVPLRVDGRRGGLMIAPRGDGAAGRRPAPYARMGITDTLRCQSNGKAPMIFWGGARGLRMALAE